ncbi:MAG: amidohydrolase family protein [Rhizobiaceae bacterium]
MRYDGCPCCGNDAAFACDSPDGGIREGASDWWGRLGIGGSGSGDRYRRRMQELSGIVSRRAAGTGRLLFKGATIVTMDPDIGNLETGDLLVEGSRIAAVERTIEAADAVEIDARGMILAPGMHDTHHHSWQGALRRLLPNGPLSEYARCTHNGFAPYYRPEDMYVGNLVTALTSLSCGITGMMDFSHNSRTPDHSDAAIEALADSGLRAVHGFAPAYTGEWDRQWPGDIERLVKKYHSGAGGRITLRLAVAFFRLESSAVEVPRALTLARDLGIEVSIDGVFDDAASRNVEKLHAGGWLKPDVTLIHCTNLGDPAWQAIRDSGTQVSLAVTSDIHYGIARSRVPVDQIRRFGIRPSLSVDAPAALSSDMFTQMRALMEFERAKAFEAGSQDALFGVADVFEFATLSGARANGLERLCGSLTPGKAADLLMIDAEAIENLPLNSALGTLVLGCDAGNIEAVFVDGHPVKWANRMLGVDLDALRRSVEASQDYLFDRAAFKPDIFAARPGPIA